MMFLASVSSNYSLLQFEEPEIESFNAEIFSKEIKKNSFLM